MHWAVLIMSAYLLGSISFSYLIVRWVAGVDVRQAGSGNAGATNAGRVAGRLVGVATLLLDIAKGVAPVVAARWLEAPEGVVGAAAAAVVLGHVFPLFLGFKGGKGVATAAGALGALSPTAMLPVVGAFALVVAITRTVSLGSVVAALTFPLSFLLLGGDVASDWALLAAGLGIAVLVVFRHLENLRRRRQGTEPRIGERRTR